MVHPHVQKLLSRAQIPQRTPEWYVARKSLITASEAASALDIKPFESYSGSPRAQLLKDKMQVEARGIDNVFTQHGNRYEDEARDLYCAMTGETAYEFGLIVHEKYPWLGCSVDGVTDTGYVLEIKCPLSRKIEPGVVPHHYYPQVQICLEVCDLEEARFIQYKPESITWPKDREFDVAVVRRDRAWFEEARPRLEAFVTEMKLRRTAETATATAASEPQAKTAASEPQARTATSEPQARTATPVKTKPKSTAVCYIEAEADTVSKTDAARTEGPEQDTASEPQASTEQDTVRTEGPEPQATAKPTAVCYIEDEPQARTEGPSTMTKTCYIIDEPPAEVVPEPPAEVVTEPPAEVVTEPPAEVVPEPEATATAT